MADDKDVSCPHCGGCLKDTSDDQERLLTGEEKPRWWHLACADDATAGVAQPPRLSPGEWRLNRHSGLKSKPCDPCDLDAVVNAPVQDLETLNKRRG